MQIQRREWESLRLFFNDMRKAGELLTKEEEKELFERMRRGDEKARNILIERNMRLCVRVAMSFAAGNTGCYEPGDLIQEGTLGLFRAVELFDESKGHKFSTYAFYHISASIRRALEEKSRTVRLPAYICEMQRRIAAAENSLRTEGLETGDRLVAERLGMPEKKVKKFRKTGFACLSMEKPISDDGLTLGDVLPSKKPSLADAAALKEAEKAAEKLLLCATPSQRYILAGRHGLAGERQTYAALAEDLGFSAERVRMAEKAALRRIIYGTKVSGRKK